MTVTTIAVKAMQAVKGMFRNMVREFVEGYRSGRSNIVVSSSPTEIINPYYIVDYETLVPQLFKKHGIQADLLVTDRFANNVMTVFASKDKELLGLESLDTKNDLLLVVERHAVNTHAMSLPDLHPALKDIDRSTMIEALIAHEIGHIVCKHGLSAGTDRKREIITTINTMTSEEKYDATVELCTISMQHEYEAWEAGRNYVREELKEVYEAINIVNIQIYKQQFNARVGKEMF